ncbi:hypothetical protein OsI_29186 [Oryza sativa Indica Group]|uniref:Uncharacterized protein n=1 Tax=Oryza sativa subsp. indica TaxID=39946 RepID=A2YV33_ORYSI|nr:hypothetical protein OsI_29186 [Oryza sativa Indica Group]
MESCCNATTTPTIPTSPFSEEKRGELARDDEEDANPPPSSIIHASRVVVTHRALDASSPRHRPGKEGARRALALPLSWLGNKSERAPITRRLARFCPACIDLLDRCHVCIDLLDRCHVPSFLDHHCGVGRREMRPWLSSSCQPLLVELSSDFGWHLRPGPSQLSGWIPLLLDA